MPNAKLFCTVRTPTKICYPRYYNSNRQLKSCLKRYADLKENLGCCTGTVASSSEPCFFIIERSVESPIERALFTTEDTSINKKKESIKILKMKLERMTSDNIVFLPSQVSISFRNVIGRIVDVKFIIVARKLFQRKYFTNKFKGCSNVKVMLLEEVKDCASRTLEEIIFNPMKDRVEKLAQLIETNTKTYIKAGENTKKYPGKSKREMAACTLCNGHPTKISKLGDIKGYVTRSKIQEIFANEFRQRIDAHRETMERLLSEILGMYNRSKIPVKDRPTISASPERNVSDKVAQELYEIDLSVKSCGYRFCILQVFVDDTSNKEINGKIRKVLQTNGILKYEIVPSIDTFKPLVNVGAKCHPDPESSSYGTVAGFATKSGNDLCALVSRHVAVHSSDRNLLLSDNQESIHAQIIQETVPIEGDNILDISAAIINKMDSKKCDTRFRDEDGDTTKGLDCSYDATDIDNRHVHIWGASTSPGLGIITMPEIRDRYADNTYIIVEDRHDTYEAFCKRGDSGAMVCADDIDGEGVEVISMVIGEDIEEKGKYATLRLDKGLEQLKRQTSKDFDMCSV